MTARNRDLSYWDAVAVWALLTGTSVGLLWYGYHTAPAHQHFMGFYDKVPDAVTYLAKMRQGYDGYWTYRNLYTSLPHAASLVNLILLLFGHLCRRTGIPLVVGFHLIRAAAAAFMFAVGVYFIRQTVADVPARRAAFYLFAIGAGWGWFVLPLAPAAKWTQECIDLWVPEAFGFYSALINPLFCLATGLLALILLHGFRGLTGSRRDLCGSAVLGALLAVIHPYDTITAAVALVIAAAWMVIRERRPAAATLWRGIIMFLPTVIVDGYTFRALHRGAGMTGWLANNVTPAPPAASLVCGLGLLLIGSFAAVVLTAGRGKTPLLPLIWAVAALLLLYSPLQFQRKFLQGISLPLGCLAGIGITTALNGRLLRTVALPIVIGTTTFTPLFVVCRAAASINLHPRIFYLTAGEYNVCRWLAGKGKREQVTLCSPHIGLHLPTLADQSVVVGHWGETVDFPGLSAAWQRFIAAGTTDIWRRAFLRRERVDLLLWTPVGLPPSAMDPGKRNYLQLVYENQGVKLFRVKRTSR